MRYEYDGNVDALYVYLTDAIPAEQVELEDVVLDLDSERRVVGVEVISTHLGWDPTAVIRNFGLPEDQASFLTFLSTVVWPRSFDGIKHQGAGTAGTTALVTTA